MTAPEAFMHVVRIVHLFVFAELVLAVFTAITALAAVPASFMQLDLSKADCSFPSLFLYGLTI